MTPERVWLTSHEAAERARVSDETIQRAAHRGRLRAYRIGRAYRFREADVDAWIDHWLLEELSHNEDGGQVVTTPTLHCDDAPRHLAANQQESQTHR